MPKPSVKRGVLFVHEVAERNGAAMSLLHFLRWFKINGRRPFSLLLCMGGDLEEEFRQVTSTYAGNASRWGPNRVRSQVMLAFGLQPISLRLERSDLRRFAAIARPSLIYLNGIASTNFRLIELLDLKVPMLTHSHGLGLLLSTQAGSAMQRILSATRRFIACSGAAKENLIAQYGVAPDCVEVVHESISIGDVKAGRSRADILRELGFPADTLLVVGCGAITWNKGTDVFLQLGRLVCRERSRAHFVWVGGPAAWQIPQLEHDARMLGLAERIRFTGLVQKPADYLSAADVFVLPSREDSFPLVALEAAALGKPILCFAGGGGMPEFVEEDCGFVVPYLDVAAMAERLLSLLDCPGCRARMGVAAHRKVAERHDIGVAAPRIMDVIEQTAAGV